MKKENILKALKKAKDESQKRNFRQSFDLIINLKGIDNKKAEHQIDDFVELHYSKGKPTKVCALVGPELYENAKKVCDHTIRQDEFSKIDKKKIKKLAKECDYFIAQANIMVDVASSFGRVLGPRGKMPNPKVGCVVPPKANLQQLYDRLQKVVMLSTKKGGTSVKTIIGNEEMKEEDIIDNIISAHDHFITSLPNGKHNISEVYVKLTMGPSVKIEGAGEGKSSKKGAEKESKEEPVKKEEKSKEKPQGDEKGLQDSTSQNKEEKPEEKGKPKSEEKAEEKKEEPVKKEEKKPEEKTEKKDE